MNRVVPSIPPQISSNYFHGYQNFPGFSGFPEYFPQNYIKNPNYPPDTYFSELKFIFYLFL
jgi:hypothetical protein